LAAALVLGITLPGLAASDETAPQTDECWPRILRGGVLSVDEVNKESFLIQFGDEELTIFVDENTRYFLLYPPKELLSLAQQRMGLRQQNQERVRVTKPAVPVQLRAVGQVPQPTRIQEHQRANLKWLRPFGEKATFDDIFVGDKVVVWLAPETDGYLAKIVTIIEPMSYTRVTGTIKRLPHDHIVIEPLSGGDRVSLEYNESTTFILKGFTSVEIGQFACAAYDTGTMTARVVRVWSEPPQLPQPAE
jgi:hypothetical protein